MCVYVQNNTDLIALSRCPLCGNLSRRSLLDYNIESSTLILNRRRLLKFNMAQIIYIQSINIKLLHAH